MKKLFFLVIITTFIVGCTLRKEGGAWTVKKTIVDEVKESIQDTKELASDVSDANNDLSTKNVAQQGGTTSFEANLEDKPSINATAPSPTPPQPKKSKKSKKSK